MKKHPKKALTQPLYDRQRTESQEAYEAFIAYRDMGAERSQAKVASGLGKSITLVNRWSSVWSWPQRVAAWDIEAGRLALAKVAKAQAAMALRHIKQAKAIQKKAVERLMKMLPEELKPSEAVDYLIQGSKLELLAMGEPTENTKSEVTTRVLTFVSMPGVEILDEDNAAA